MERILIILSFLYFVVLTVKAGTCFRSRNALGKCVRPIMTQISRNSCCSMRGSFFTRENYQNWWIVSLRNNGASNCTRTCGIPNSCSGVACPRNQVCEIRSGLPTCICRVQCSEESRIPRTLCASNGRTFRSECAMEVAKCRDNDIITRIRFYGNCLDASTCTYDRCPFGKVCVLNRFGRPDCQIRISCRRSPNDIPFCGDDGVSYHNKCYLLMASQNRGHEITVVHRGNCLAASQRPRSVSNLRWLSF